MTSQTHPSQILAAMAARQPLIAIPTREPDRALEVLTAEFEGFCELHKAQNQASEQGKPEVLVFDAFSGWVAYTLEGGCGRNQKFGRLDDGLKHFIQLHDQEEKANPMMLVIRDPSPFLDTPSIVQGLRTVADVVSNNDTPHRAAMIGAVGGMPEPIQPVTYVVDFPLPLVEDLEALVTDIIAAQPEAKLAEKEMPALLAQSLAGLGLDEARNTTRRVLALRSSIDREFVTKLAAAKIEVVKHIGGGAIQLEPVPEKEINVIGMDLIEEEAETLRLALETPGKRSLFGGGQLLIGPPGTGKTLFVRRMSQILNIPTLKVDIGAMFASRLGETESIVRTVLQMARAVAPVIVFFDEIEKAMPSVGGSQRSEGGVGSRMVASLLSFMQDCRDRNDPVLFVGTANLTALDNLLPEMLSRFGRKWFVPEPNELQLAEIFRVHLEEFDQDIQLDYDEIVRFLKQQAGSGKPVGRDVMNICYSAALISLRDGQIEEEHVKEAVVKMLTNTQELGGGIMATNVGGSFKLPAKAGRDKGAVLLVGGDNQQKEIRDE